VEPLFFGTNNRLYGVLHTPPQGTCNRAVLICSPIGQEYLRLHRSLAWLSNMLAQKGFGVLRFDYRGTGDSADLLEQVTLKDWLEDGEEAVAEVQEQFGDVALSIIGIRLGAIIALHCSTGQPVERLLLWEGCLDGGEFLAELSDDMALRPLPKRNFLASDGAMHHNGFTYTADLQQSLRAKPSSASALQQVNAQQVLLLDRSVSGDVEQASTPPIISQHICEVEFSWLDVDVIGSAIIPHKALGQIVKLIS